MSFTGDSAGEWKWDSHPGFLTQVGGMSRVRGSVDCMVWESLYSLSMSGPRSSVFGRVIYFVMIIIGLLQQAILVSLRSLLHTGIIHPHAVAVQFIFL